MTEKRLQKRLHPVQGDDSRLAPLIGNISQCWRCSHCKWVPSPKSHAFAGACPSVEWGGFHAYSGGGKVITAFTLKEKIADYSEKALEAVFACTACGACDISCKSNNGDNVEPLEVIYALRATVVDEGQSPDAHKQIIANMKAHGNAYGLPAAEREAWANGVTVKDARSNEVDVLLHIGCENAYDPTAWNELKAIVRFLNEAGVSFGILREQEKATGEFAFDLGYEELAKEQAQAMLDMFNRSNAKRIVTCSSTSYSGVRNCWPRLKLEGPDKPFHHITEYVLELIELGQLNIKPSFKGRVTYHDPSKLGRLSEKNEYYAPYKEAPFTKWIYRNNTIPVREQPRKVLFGNDGLYEAPRRLIEAIQGIELVEMERNRLAAYSSGASGGAKEAYPEFARFAGLKRLEEAEMTGADLLVTSCSKVKRHLLEVAGETGIQTIGIFELLANAIDGTADRLLNKTPERV